MGGAPKAATAALLDVVQELLCVLDADGTVTWAGPAWHRTLGLEPQHLEGTSLCDLAHPDDSDRLALELILLRERGRLTSGFECRMLSATGATHWVGWTGVDGPDGLVLSGSDVTARRQSGRDHGRAELITSALDAIVSIDEDDRIVEFNPSAELTFGLSESEALGRGLAELIVPASHRQAHREGVRRVADGGEFKLLGKRLELPAQRSDGTEFPAELTITQTSTEPFRVTAFVRDLSGEQAARAALEESERRYAQAFDQAPVGIVLVSIDPADPGRLLSVNEALCRMTGYAEDHLLAGTYAQFIHSDDIAANQKMFAEVIAGKRAGYEIEKRLLRRDGSVMWALVHATVARDADGQGLYGIGQIQDITARKTAEAALRASEQRLTRTERLARIGAWEWDREQDQLSWSSGLDTVFGSLDSRRVSTLAAFLASVHPGDREHLRRLIDDVLACTVVQAWEYRIVRAGRVAHVYSWGEAVVGEDGAVTGMLGYAQDVTERRQAEDRAAELTRDNDLILDSAGEGILRVDVHGCTTYVNPAAARLLGYTPAELTGRQIHELIHHTHPNGSPYDWEHCPAARSVVTGEIRRATDDVLWRRDGSALPVECTIAPMREGDRVTGAVVVFSDVTERRELEDRLRALSEIDPLTGLTNRRRFEEVVAAHLASPDGDGGALLILDLDHFKFVNDSFGHAAGDDLIRAIAAVLADRLRDQDVLARLGGDEFAVLLPAADAQEVQAVARRLTTGIEGARPSGLQIGASVGVTCFASDTQVTAGDLLVSADIALYEAKEKGRGRVEFFAGQPGTSLTWVQRIRAALDEDRFVLHSQPIVDLATGRPVQEELLVRMIDDDGAVLAPGQFLPTAETFGLIGDIDHWVLAHGLEIAAAGRRVHINLSGRSVGSTAWLDHLSGLLQSTGTDPDLLVFELTETAAVSNMTEAQAFAEQLRSLGCRLALDDFGTGFGSFTYLHSMPADYLKIDMAFVRNLARSENDLRVVEAVVGVAARFGQRTVAEGVEEGAALDILRKAGVDYAQGYHLGRPTLTRA